MRPFRSFVLALLVPLAPRAFAQAMTVTAATELRLAPDGRELASMRTGAVVQGGAASGGWTQVTVDGWLHVSTIGPKRDSFPLSVKSPAGALMRASPERTGVVVAQLDDGMGLSLVQRGDQWFRVKRMGWIQTKKLKSGAAPVAATPPKPAAAPAPAPTAPASAPTTAAVPPPTPTAPPESMPGDVAIARRTAILTAPTGHPLGTLDSATRLVTGPVERGWVKVTLEGWVRQADVVPLDTASISAISAADLRAEPDKYKGRTVRWVVQVIAFQTADPLRKGLANDEPYLLARGPGAESSLLYLALPESLLDLAKSLKPLSSVVVIARVRVGKSEPSGVPVLDLQRIIQR